MSDVIRLEVAVVVMMTEDDGDSISRSSVCVEQTWFLTFNLMYTKLLLG